MAAGDDGAGPMSLEGGVAGGSVSGVDTWTRAAHSLTVFTDPCGLCDICDSVNCVFFKVHLICEPVFVYKVISV